DDQWPGIDRNPCGDLPIGAFISSADILVTNPNKKRGENKSAHPTATSLVVDFVAFIPPQMALNVRDKTNQMHSDAPRLIRAAPATVIIFSVLFSPALLLGVLLIVRGQQIREALGLVALYAVAVYWVCSPSIELAANRLIYRSLLKRAEIDLSQVSRVTMSANPAPTVTLTRKDGGTPLSFIVKPFSKLGIVAMFRHIRERSPDVQLDGISHDMSEGDFGTITKEAISTRNLIRIALTVSGSALAAALARAVFKH
ncbi:hypothetical protein JIN85_20100, partial [Luteolibacter pohnpeiensis]